MHQAVLHHAGRARPPYTSILRVTRGPPEGWPQYDSSDSLNSQSTRVYSDEEEYLPVLELETRSVARLSNSNLASALATQGDFPRSRCHMLDE